MSSQVQKKFMFRSWTHVGLSKGKTELVKEDGAEKAECSIVLLT